MFTKEKYSFHKEIYIRDLIVQCQTLDETPKKEQIARSRLLQRVSSDLLRPLEFHNTAKEWHRRKTPTYRFNSSFNLNGGIQKDVREKGRVGNQKELKHHKKRCVKCFKQMQH